MTVVTGAVVEYAPSHHRSIRRANDFTLDDRPWAWHLLPLHLVSALAFTAIMVSVANNAET
jgi:quinol-cytochrome oxidoreductase complex cytochrome b subunit